MIKSVPGLGMKELLQPPLGKILRPKLEKAAIVDGSAQRSSKATPPCQAAPNPYPTMPRHPLN